MWSRWASRTEPRRLPSEWWRAHLDPAPDKSQTFSYSELAITPKWRDLVQDHIDRRRSQQQICQAPRTTFPDQPEIHAVHETI
ncbi:hypothetical protein [Streptomyces chryseus]|uniref:hypothetical protein n=1 Tax=Streptomyces chryseus TaxID=68186 RepID=UPI00142EDF73|nr:hypothetical protein [Streptomyces chryseus]GGX46269.1 hypothetical protein GCM10010353_71110 [Streptomyces chryseus]